MAMHSQLDNCTHIIANNFINWINLTSYTHLFCGDLNSLKDLRLLFLKINLILIKIRTFSDIFWLLS